MIVLHQVELVLELAVNKGPSELETAAVLDGPQLLQAGVPQRIQGRTEAGQGLPVVGEKIDRNPPLGTKGDDVRRQGDPAGGNDHVTKLLLGNLPDDSSLLLDHHPPGGLAEEGPRLHDHQLGPLHRLSEVFSLLPFNRLLGQFFRGRLRRGLRRLGGLWLFGLP